MMVVRDEVSLRIEDMEVVQGQVRLLKNESSRLREVHIILSNSTSRVRP